MNLMELTPLGRRVLRWVQSQGQVICFDTAEQQRLSVLLDELQPVFPELGQVHAWYTYRQTDQPPPLNEHDGETWIDVTLDGSGTLYAVGIATEVLSDHYQSILILLHELTHVVIDGGKHDRYFHSILDGLLDRYSGATGQSVKNDYFGRELRFDSRPIPPSWFADPADEGVRKTLTRREWAELAKSFELANMESRKNKEVPTLILED